VLNSLIMKITANEDDINDILQICNAPMMITGVIEKFAICRLISISLAVIFIKHSLIKTNGDLDQNSRSFNLKVISHFLKNFADCGKN